MATKFRSIRSYSKGRNQTWSKRGVNSGPNPEGMQALYKDAVKGLGGKPLTGKAAPHTLQQREGKTFLVKDQKGNYIVEREAYSLRDPVDPYIRVKELIKVIRTQGSKVEEFLFIYIFNTPTLKVRHFWYGNDHFLERENVFKGIVQRSRMYQGRDEMLYSFNHGLIFWHEVKEEQRNTPP